jgi:TolC family type I secretion outer membrane protein
VALASLAARPLPAAPAPAAPSDRLVTGSVTPPGPSSPSAATSSAVDATAGLAASPTRSGSDRRPGPPGAKPLTFEDVIARAVMTHPDMAVARAQADEARAGVTISRAGFLPQVDTRLNVGVGAPDAPDSDYNPYLDGTEGQAQANVTFRQMVYDFGATRDDVERSRSALSAQNFRTMDRAEEIARRMADAYLKILEQRALLRAADTNLAETRKLADLVRANQKDGNGTVADVSHIDARMVEAQTIRTNLQSDLGAAEDQFRRLAKANPGELKPPPSLARLIPPQVDQAIATAETSHPRLLSLRAMGASVQAELDNKRNSRLPRVSFEASASAKERVGVSDNATFDVRGMLVMRYRLFDGGAQRGAEEQISARLTQNDMRLISERDEIESDLREFYRAVQSARAKYASLQEGLNANRQAQELYVEQFKAGKRTVFELLDRQTGSFQAQREVITNRYAELRAQIGILRSLGLLTSSVVGRRTALN